MYPLSPRTILLSSRLVSVLEQKRWQLSTAVMSLQHLSPRYQVDADRQRVDALNSRVEQAMRSQLLQLTNRFSIARARLTTVNPWKANAFSVGNRCAWRALLRGANSTVARWWRVSASCRVPVSHDLFTGGAGVTLMRICADFNSKNRAAHLRGTAPSGATGVSWFLSPSIYSRMISPL